MPIVLWCCTRSMTGLRSAVWILQTKHDCCDHACSVSWLDGQPSHQFPAHAAVSTGSGIAHVWIHIVICCICRFNFLLFRFYNFLCTQLQQIPGLQHVQGLNQLQGVHQMQVPGVQNFQQLQTSHGFQGLPQGLQVLQNPQFQQQVIPGHQTVFHGVLY